MASKVGLSGRAVAIVPDERAAELARRAAEQLGVLVEIEVTSVLNTPLEDGSIDLAVIDDTAGLFGAMPPATAPPRCARSPRILRPGGRVILIGATPRTGLSGLLARNARGAAFCGIRRSQSGALGKRLQHRAHACRARGPGVRRRHQAEDVARAGCPFLSTAGRPCGLAPTEKSTGNQSIPRIRQRQAFCLGIGVPSTAAVGVFSLGAAAAFVVVTSRGPQRAVLVAFRRHRAARAGRARARP